LVSLLCLVFPQYSLAGQINLRSDLQKINVDSIYSEITEHNYANFLPKISRIQFPIKRSFYSTVTAYSSSPDETSGDPFITASGARTESGVLAHQYLPFGTKVRFPDQFGEKIFVVQDRLHERHTSYYHFDMWSFSKAEAKVWGARQIRVEILD